MKHQVLFSLSSAVQRSSASRTLNSVLQLSAASFSMSSSSFSKEDTSYEAAITALNSLQTNAVLLKKILAERQKHVHLNLPQTRLYLERSGMKLEDLDTLKTIHVSGTKGKGSTCAFTESILRRSGLRTGFYSSPHLVSATERVRLDGQPIPKNKFTEYFWPVYDKVCRGRGPEDRPPYFQFLTVLAFNIFVREKVDVAIIEVGIGGEYDNTNIIRNPVVTGITALGLDHTNILGNTITDIAWHKGGIMKPGVAAYIDGNQPPEALEVLGKRAEELNAASIACIPDLTDYDWGSYPMLLGLHGEVQQRNASLALVLSAHFLASEAWRQDDQPPVSRPDPEGGNIPVVQPFPISAESALGLRLTDWPGRSQMLDHGRVVYMLDGAHTEESIKSCRAWYPVASKLAIKNPRDKIFKVLLFNTTKERDPRTLLQPFSSSDLDLVVFCTNLSGRKATVDQQNFTTTEKIQMSRCEHHLHVWTKLQTSPSSTSLFTDRLPKQNSIPGLVIPSILEALQWITQGTDRVLQGYECIPAHPVPQELEEADQVQILITGSLHLVGGVLALIEPEGLPVRKDDPAMVASYYNLQNPGSLPSSVPGML